MEILTRWQDPTIDELRKENERLKNVIYNASEKIQKRIDDFDRNTILSFGLFVMEVKHDLSIIQDELIGSIEDKEMNKA